MLELYGTAVPVMMGYPLVPDLTVGPDDPDIPEVATTVMLGNEYGYFLLVEGSDSDEGAAVPLPVGKR